MSSGSGQLYTLSPDQSILYTWDSPAGERQLKWQVIGAVERDWHTLLFEQVSLSKFNFFFHIECS